jgi:hypothetical protein
MLREGTRTRDSGAERAMLSSSFFINHAALYQQEHF